MKKGEIVASGLIVAFFIFMLMNSLELHEIRRFGEMGSGFWPILILSSATLLSMILLISNFRKYLKDKEKTPSGTAISSEAQTDSRKRRKKNCTQRHFPFGLYCHHAMDWIWSLNTHLCTGFHPCPWRKKKTYPDPFTHSGDHFSDPDFFQVYSYPFS